jgi:hypothetical protein
MGYHVCGWIESNWERPQERDDTISAPHAPKPYDDELVGGWKAVIESIGFLSSRVNANRQPYDQLRLIVWAIW